MKRKTLPLLLALVLAASLSGGCAARRDAYISGNIIHAGGAVGEYTVTNSLEAIEAAYAAGERFLEIDFCLTADGQAVCLHDWNRHFLPGYEREDFPLTVEEFSRQKIYGELTPLTLDGLAEWLAGHEDVSIVTDTKEGDLITLSLIARTYPELQERFIPQIYAESELEPVRSLGYEHVIYTLYRLSNEEKMDPGHIAAFAAENKLTGITFPWELTQTEGYVDALAKGGVPLYTHTLNDPEAIKAQLGMGITGVYTDTAGL